VRLVTRTSGAPAGAAGSTSIRIYQLQVGGRA
jgi:hypothetical protein